EARVYRTATCQPDIRAGPITGSRRGSAAAPPNSGLDEAVDVTVENCLWIADLVLGAQVLDHLVRVQDVAAHLVAPGVAAVLEGVHGGLLLFAAALEQL